MPLGLQDFDIFLNIFLMFRLGFFQFISCGNCRFQTFGCLLILLRALALRCNPLLAGCGQDSRWCWEILARHGLAVQSWVTGLDLMTPFSKDDHHSAWESIPTKTRMGFHWVCCPIWGTAVVRHNCSRPFAVGERCGGSKVPRPGF